MKLCRYCCGVSLSQVVCQSCQEAWSQMALKGAERFCRINKLWVRSLFRWEQGNDHSLRELILRQKRGGSFEVWKALAFEFLGTDQLNGARALIVPAPSRRGFDHAFWWGVALSGLTGAPLFPALNYDGTIPRLRQREQSKAQRAQLRFVTSQGAVQYIAKVDLVIFVDDVITTGSTAVAAFKALGEPSAFQVWTCARRSLL